MTCTLDAQRRGLLLARVAEPESATVLLQLRSVAWHGPCSPDTCHSAG